MIISAAFNRLSSCSHRLLKYVQWSSEGVVIHDGNFEVEKYVLAQLAWGVGRVTDPGGGKCLASAGV